jgi:hypothetical protein
VECRMRNTTLSMLRQKILAMVDRQGSRVSSYAVN